jgi:hypothetical protein
MKLYDLSPGDNFILAGDDDSPVFRFERLDGMYSICWLGDSIVHLAAFTPVIRFNKN